MANLVELFDNIVQMQALNGVPLANGKLYVYALGRTRLMDTWSDVDGESLNTNPIILDDAGQAHVYVSDDFDYTLVVCDAYDNEIFSIDKYLYSKGEHSHADVAVAPSEHIGVSSYHVGETTVYVPYIQGELGKTYHGIEPIVVNNQENKISARNIPLGVQEPLYFVEDSESACIIGADTSAFGGNSTLTLRTNGIKDGTYNTLGTYTPLSGSKNIDIPREVYTFTIGNNSCFYNDVIMAYLNSKVLVALEIESWYEDGQQKQNVYENFAQKQFWGNNNFYNGGYVNFVRVDVEKNQIVTWKCEPETPGSITGYAKWTKTVSDLGSGGLFIAEYGAPGTTYEEIDAAFNAGKTVIAHKKVGNIDQYYQLCEIRKYPDHIPNVDCYVFAYRYSYIAEELFRFQSNWSNLETDLATWDYVNQQISAGDFATHADLSEFIPWNASGEFQSAGNYATTEDLTAYYPASNPSGFINSDAISAMATTGFVADVSAEITGMIPGDYLTKDSADTLYQPIGSYLSSNALEGYATENWVTSQGYITTETDWTDTITAASANAYNEATAAIPAPFDPSYLSGQIDTKLDSAIYAEDSGKFLTAHQSLADYQTTAGMTAYQPVGDYLTTGDSANFYPSDNPSAFITGVDLTPYQTVEGMTAYQPVGDYYSASNPSGFITGVDLTPYQLTADMTAYQPAGDYLTTADSANFYTTANESGFITGVPDTYLQNTDLTITDGKVTEISGVPLSAGDELPSGVMNTSALEYNAVNEISGYNGSAIAQYGAEKQWLQHDDTLVHAANSAQYALGVNLSAVAQLLGIDETLLWSGEPEASTTTAKNYQLSENLRNFKKFKVVFNAWNQVSSGGIQRPAQEFTFNLGWNLNNEPVYANFPAVGIGGQQAVTNYWYLSGGTGNITELGLLNGARWSGSNYSNSVTSMSGSILQIIGIGRKQ